MILSPQTIRRLGILEPMVEGGRDHGVSHGLSCAGYDLRLDLGALPDVLLFPGSFLLAATMERFSMPLDVVGTVHDKSTFARRGMSAFSTVIEPGWKGYLTLELVNHGHKPIRLEQGMGIVQVIFHRMDKPTESPYTGKYQDQARGPQGPR